MGRTTGNPQSHLDLPLHRHDAASRAYRDKRVLLARTPRMCIPRWVDRASHRVQDAVNLDGSCPGGQSGHRRKASSTPITPSVTRSLPAHCAHDGAGRASSYGRPHQGLATPFPSSSTWTSLADDSPRRFGSRHSLRPRRGTSAARTPHADLDLVTETVRYGCSLLHDAVPSCSTSVSPAARHHAMG